MSRIDATKAKVYVCTGYKCSREDCGRKRLHLINCKSIEEFIQAGNEIHPGQNPGFNFNSLANILFKEDFIILLRDGSDPETYISKLDIHMDTSFSPECSSLCLMPDLST
jgi:hypothetical protein